MVSIKIFFILINVNLRVELTASMEHKYLRSKGDCVYNLEMEADVEDNRVNLWKEKNEIFRLLNAERSFTMGDYDREGVFFLFGRDFDFLG